MINENSAKKPHLSIMCRLTVTLLPGTEKAIAEIYTLNCSSERNNRTEKLDK